jgi:hypothetical protein
MREHLRRDVDERALGTDFHVGLTTKRCHSIGGNSILIAPHQLQSIETDNDIE